VTILARHADALESVLAEMGGSERGHELCAGDLMPEGKPGQIVRELLARRGAYDIVVHAVGGTLQVSDILAEAAEWQRVWRFNMGIAIEINAVLLPVMRQRRWGRVVHVSSISGKSLRGSAPYAVAKAGLNAEEQVRMLAEMAEFDGRLIHEHYRMLVGRFEPARGQGTRTGPFA